MTGIRLDIDWLNGERVRAPELAETWAALKILVDEDELTIVRERETGSYRSTIHASVYPLAEWITFNWWRLTTPGGGRKPAGESSAPPQLSLADAGDGFHWPDVQFRPSDGFVDVTVRSHRSPEERIAYQVEGHWTVASVQFETTLRSFVETVSAKLELGGLTATPMQLEWQAINQMNAGEIEFARAAAALGEDPFAPDESVASALLLASEEVANVELLVEMLAVTQSNEVVSGAKWLTESESVARRLPLDRSDGELARLRAAIPLRDRRLTRRYSESPWSLGFQRARALRATLDLGYDPVDVDLINVGRTELAAPSFVEGVLQLTENDTGLVIPSERPRTSERFLQARSLHRTLFTDAVGMHIITDASSISDQVERAFAAEYLAPAMGVAGTLGRDYSDRSIANVAKKFSVDRRVIEHQIENQIRA